MAEYPFTPPPAGVDADRWESAVRSLRDYCGWHIAPVVTEEVILDGPGCGILTLPTQRLVGIENVTNDGRPVEVASSDWSRTGIVRGSWTGSFRGVMAVITHGYEDWPADLLGVLVELATESGQARVSQVTNRAYQLSFDVKSEAERRRGVIEDYRLMVV